MTVVPRIVLLPGLDGDAALRAPLKQALGAIAPTEVIGYPPELFRYDDILDHVRPHLPTTDFVLVAESFGGPLAIRLASERPPGLAGIVFVATFAQSPAPVPNWLIGILKHLPAPRGSLLNLILRIGGGRRARIDVMADMAAVAERLPRRTATGRLAEVLSTDLRRELAALDVPLVCLQPQHDRSVPARMATDFVRVGARLVTLPGTHYLAEEHPAAVAEALAGPIRAMLERP